MKDKEVWIKNRWESIKAETGYVDNSFVHRLEVIELGNIWEVLNKLDQASQSADLDQTFILSEN